MVIFKDTRHESAFYHLLDKMELDQERVALAYLLALNEDCSRHVKDLYDFEQQVIVPDGLNQAWQTSASLKTTRLAFNLYNGYSSGEECLPVQLFNCEDAAYYWEAIKLRYPEYTEED